MIIQIQTFTIVQFEQNINFRLIILFKTFTSDVKVKFRHARLSSLCKTKIFVLFLNPRLFINGNNFNLDIHNCLVSAIAKFMSEIII